MTLEQLKAYAEELKIRMDDESISSRESWELLQEYKRVLRSISAN